MRDRLLLFDQSSKNSPFRIEGAFALFNIIERLFPFFILFDRDFKLIAAGKSFAKLESLLSDGRPLAEFLTIKYPLFEFSQCQVEDLLYIDQVWEVSSSVAISGQVVPLQKDLFIYAGSPTFSSPEQLTEYDLKISDFAAHASPLEYLFLKQAQKTAIEDQERITRALLESEQRRKSLQTLQQELGSQLGVAFDLKIQFDHDFKISNMDVSGKIDSDFDRKAIIGKDLFAGASFISNELHQAIEASKVNARVDFEFIIKKSSGNQHFKACLAQSNSTYLLLAHDCTREYLYQRDIEWRANYDALTSTLSRRYFFEQAERFIESPVFSGTKIGFFLFDLDAFKDVNDLHGHLAGDFLLKYCADIINARLPRNSLVTRLGGDEFAAIISDKSRDDIIRTAGMIVAAIKEPVRYKNVLLRVTCCIGVSFFETGDESVEMLNQQADIAMYCAKLKNHESPCIYDEQMAQNYSEQLSLRDAIVSSIQAEDVDIFFQPIVSANKAAIVSFEALSRWRTAPLADISVEKVIKLAEEGGQITDLGRIIIKKALRSWGEYRNSQHWVGNQTVAINLSAKQLIDHSLPDMLVAAAKKNKIPCTEIVIELTETAFNADQQESLRMITRLRELGCKIALDDFGTGYSSLAYLETLPINKIKIDRVFIAAITSDLDEYPLLDAIVKLAKALNLKVVAEGAETKVQTEKLAAMGCDTIQGYYFSRPLPKADFLKLSAEKYLPNAASIKEA